MDDPSRILAQARQQLEALKQSGLTRDDLLALLEEGTQQQQQQQQQTPQQQQQQQQQQHHHHQRHITPDASSLQNFNYQDINASFKAPPQYRSSVSTVSSSSSRDSYFSTTSVRSSVSSMSNPANESKFWCTSCNKTFKRKFDWKRHEEEFHDRSRKYPCDSCNQSFWGPNTFNQHHKSAHGCQTCPHAEMVMKPMKKRRAYGCGFCAALHGQFERHIDHVATHFETGMTKQDWSHSNVIYGLLHQHGIIEAWKALIASKFNERQPMFGWSPDSTGRAHGFVENENPGQLQDLLEFFDGSKESARRIIQLAETCVHVVLRPKSPSSSPSSGNESMPQSSSSPSSSSGAHRQSSVPRSTAREARRSTSTSVIVKSNKTNRRITSGSNLFETQSPNPALTPMSPISGPSSTSSSQTPPPHHRLRAHQSHQQLRSTNNTNNTIYPTFIDVTQHHQIPMNIYTDKALPPPPLDPPSPMAIDFPPFQEAHHHTLPQQHQTQSFLPEVDLMSDWQSFTSTLVDGIGHEHQHQHQHPQQTLVNTTPFTAQGGFPMSWDDLGQFAGQGGP